MQGEWVLHTPKEDGPFRALAMLPAQRFAPPLYIVRAHRSEMGAEDMDRALDALRDVGCVLPPSFDVEYIVPQPARPFRARTSLGAGLLVDSP